jgi:hypothetical protein
MPETGDPRHPSSLKLRKIQLAIPHSSLPRPSASLWNDGLVLLEKEGQTGFQCPTRFLICGISIIDELAAVQPVHVAAFIKDLQAEVSPPTVKQHLAAIRMLFDGLVTGHIIDVNPAHAVRWPKCVVKKG